MFTGIIEELGEVKSILPRSLATLIKIKAKKVQEDIKIGDSLSVNGVCLTLIEKESDALTFEVIPQTLKVTNLGSLRVSDKVNLERSLKIGSRLSGHFVTGHVDCLGTIRRKNYINNNLKYEIAVPPVFMNYILPKGSIAVDGISLTIADMKAGTFNIFIIPHTLENTTLKAKGPSDKVNIEFDILAKKV